MIYTIETMLRKGFRDRHGEHVRQDILDSGIANAPKVRYSQLYRIEGDLTRQELEAIAARLLTDPVTDSYLIAGGERVPKKAGGGKRHDIEVWLKHGVTDTVAESVVKAVRDLGIDKDLKVKTGHKFVFEGTVTAQAVRQIAERQLVNPMVQEYIIQ
jgi:phosphoribosylformylglycinamidine synthase